MEYTFRRATSADSDKIWEILQEAIARRGQEGSKQWQDGYPNPEVIASDIDKGIAFVLVKDRLPVGYTAVLINDEPGYAKIDGKWLSPEDEDFLVLHRIAISTAYSGLGLGRKILGFVEDYARQHGIRSIKADTNFDNPAMMRSFEKAGYVYCGEVIIRDAPRRAYEKLLNDPHKDL